jgi:hypothetical protein
MPFNQNITPGAPPLLWSDVNEAFTLINENFDVLVATIGGGSGLTPIDFTSLDTSVKPTVDDLRDLGDITHKWGAVFSSEHTTIKPLNGLWAGAAQVKGVGLTINLPDGSTVGGDPITGIGTSLIIDPDKTFFKIIEVDSGNSIVANTFGDTLNLISGSGVNMLVSSGADSITISNTGVLSVTASSGISVSTVSGTATVTNTGVRSLQSTTALPAGRTTGAGINITGATGDNIRVTNTGVISITSGVGITVSADAATGDVTITNSAPAGNTFAQVEVNGESANRLVADAAADVLNIASGEGITLTKDPATDTLTIAVNPVFDLRGSVFADDSTVMVDAVSGTLRGIFIGSVFADDSSQIIDGNTATVYGNIEATTLRTSDLEIALGGNVKTGQGFRAVAVGADAGLVDQGTRTVAIGNQAGELRQSNYGVAVGASAAYFEQGDSAVAIGDNAGQSSQGDYAIAVGHYAGHNNQSANSIILNASGAILNGAAAGFYVNPIRSTANGRPLMYDTATKELFSSNVLEFFGSRISTSDSSGIVVDVQTTFNTDVVFENDITVAERLTVKGSRVINLTELQAITAASTDFADFQTRIAALA